MSVKIEHRIGVQAPADTIWAVIADIPAWERWNPLYPKAAGQMRMGEALTLTLALPGHAARTIQPRVLDWTPNELLHLRLSALGGLVNSVRYIEIESLGPANCILANGELFRGPAASFAVRRLGRSMRQGFAQMGEALAARAEAAWRSEAGAPTSDAP